MVTVHSMITVCLTRQESLGGFLVLLLCRGTIGGLSLMKGGLLRARLNTRPIKRASRNNPRKAIRMMNHNSLQNPFSAPYKPVLPPELDSAISMNMKYDISSLIITSKSPTTILMKWKITFLTNGFTHLLVSKKQETCLWTISPERLKKTILLQI